MYMAENSNSDDEESDMESITGKPKDEIEQPLVGTQCEPIPLSASLFQRNTRLAQVCVMLCVVMERTSYYGLLGNLAYFLTSNLEYSSDQSIELVLSFSGLTWISCCIGGVLGDHFDISWYYHIFSLPRNQPCW